MLLEYSTSILPIFMGITRVDKVIILQILIASMSDTIIYQDINSTNVLLEPSVDDSFKAKVTDYGTANLQQ